MLKENQGAKMGDQGNEIENYSVEAAFQKRRQEVEAILTAFLPEEKGPAKTGIEAMNYSLMVEENGFVPSCFERPFYFSPGKKDGSFSCIW